MKNRMQKSKALLKTMKIQRLITDRIYYETMLSLVDDQLKAYYEEKLHEVNSEFNFLTEAEND